MKTYTPAQYAWRQNAQLKLQTTTPFVLLIAFFSVALSYPFIGPGAALLTPIAILSLWFLAEWLLIPRDQMYYAQRSHY